MNIESIKSPGPNFTKEEMYEEIITDLSKEELVILERFAIIEEMIYGEILRHNPKFNFEDLMQIKENIILSLYIVDLKRKRIRFWRQRTNGRSYRTI